MAGLLDSLDWATESPRLTLSRGETLFKQGDVGAACYIVESGRLQARATDDLGQERVLGQVDPGEPVGEMEGFLGGRRMASVVALDDATLVELPRLGLDRLAESHPELYQLLLTTVQRRLRRNHLLALLPRLLGSLDEAGLDDLEARIEWVTIQRGETLLRQGDPGDSLYILVSGRLSAVHTDGGGVRRVVAEIVRGETVGELGVFTGKPRVADVVALRRSLLVRLSAEDVDGFLANHPSAYRHLTTLLLRRAHRASRPAALSRKVVNIALVPVHPGVPLAGFAESLAEAMNEHAPTIHLSAARLDALTGYPSASVRTPDHPSSYGVTAWLDEREHEFRFVLYEADPEVSPWTSRCLARADRILLVADAKAAPQAGQFDELLASSARACPQALVLLHQNGEEPSDTGAWRKGRSLELHLHVRTHSRGDVERVARIIADRAVGLVLGGGGARGFAHIGVVRAIREAGLAVDFVGGTSMGAFIAAQVAMGWDWDTMLDRNREAWVDRRPFRKHWLPIYSIMKSRSLDDATRKVLFGDRCIEDLWTSCFMISSALSSGAAVVHDDGPVWKACRASSALPGIITPVLYRNQLHVDGGLLDNLPVDVMRQRCGGRVIAVDVSGAAGLVFDVDTEPGPMDYVKDWWRRSTRTRGFPKLMDVLLRATLLGGTQRVQRARVDADLLLQPPVSKWGLLEFEAIEEVARVGYDYAVAQLEQWATADAPPGDGWSLLDPEELDE